MTHFFPILVILERSLSVYRERKLELAAVGIQEKYHVD